jgi:hypothetical protein
MALVIPNLESSPTFDAQAIGDATDQVAQLALAQQTGVVSGCAVSAQSSPNMTVAVAAGSVVVGGTAVAVSAVSSLSIGAASGSDRKDIVVVDNTGTVSVVAGTPCGTAGWSRNTANPFTNPPPIKPAIPSSSVLLGEVYVAASTTEIDAGNLIDKTPIVVVIISDPGRVFLNLFDVTASTDLPTGGFSGGEVPYLAMAPPPGYFGFTPLTAWLGSSPSQERGQVTIPLVQTVAGDVVGVNCDAQLSGNLPDPGGVDVFGSFFMWDQAGQNIGVAGFLLSSVSGNAPLRMTLDTLLTTGDLSFDPDNQGFISAAGLVYNLSVYAHLEWD